MPEEGSRRLRGSVIQRTLIPDGLSAVLNVATVPVSELCADPEELDFTGLVAEVLGIADQTILDQEQYGEIEPRLRSGPWDFFPAHPFWEEFHDLWRRAYGKAEPIHPLGQHPAGLLATHALALMVRPSVPNAYFQPLAVPWGPRSEGISEERRDLAMRCFVASRNPGDRVTAFIETIGEYDVPSGQSPATASDTLQAIIASSSKACVAPLLVGGSTAGASGKCRWRLPARASCSTAASRRHGGSRWPMRSSAS